VTWTEEHERETRAAADLIISAMRYGAADGCDEAYRALREAREQGRREGAEQPRPPKFSVGTRVRDPNWSANDCSKGCDGLGTVTAVHEPDEPGVKIRWDCGEEGWADSPSSIAIVEG
jgi:hypothetical protein